MLAAVGFLFAWRVSQVIERDKRSLGRDCLEEGTNQIFNSLKFGTQKFLRRAWGDRSRSLTRY